MGSFSETWLAIELTSAPVLHVLTSIRKESLSMKTIFIKTANKIFLN